MHRERPCQVPSQETLARKDQPRKRACHQPSPPPRDQPGRTGQEGPAMKEEEYGRRTIIIMPPTGRLFFCGNERVETTHFWFTYYALPLKTILIEIESDDCHFSNAR